jgi:hypothetical protein
VKALRWAGLVLSAVLLGIGSLLAVRATTPTTAPPNGTYTLGHAEAAYGALLGLLVVIGVALAIAGRGLRLGRAPILAAVCIAAVTTAVVTGAPSVMSLERAVTTGPSAQTAPLPTTQPAGAIAAARWLRDHSSPTDLVATNSHCRIVHPNGGCDSREFWVAAYSERQVLVEGWSYTEPAYDSGGLWDGTLSGSHFWDHPMLAANDLVFYHPTAARIVSFVSTYHVRWLVAVGPLVSPLLASYATLRFTTGDVSVYELPTVA